MITEPEGTFDVKATRTRPPVVVSADGVGVVSHAGSRVLVDLAVSIADGGEAISDIATLGDQPDVFGGSRRIRRVGGCWTASTTPIWTRSRRPAPSPGSGVVPARRGDGFGAAGDQRRGCAGDGRDGEPVLVTDIDATIVLTHSERTIRSIRPAEGGSICSARHCISSSPPSRSVRSAHTRPDPARPRACPHQRYCTPGTRDEHRSANGGTRSCLPVHWWTPSSGATTVTCEVTNSTASRECGFELPRVASARC